MSDSELFNPINIGRFHAKNCFVRSATKEGLCDGQGHISAELYDIYKRLSKSEIGTIIVSSARVKLFECTVPDGMFRLDNYELLEEFKQLAEICKSGHATAIVQATYSHMDINSLNTEELDRIVSDYVDAALFIQKAGFDGIQIHEAHTVFLSQFKSPRYNKRRDEYGINKNLLSERILSAIRKTVNNDFIIINKINSQDFEENGLTEDESLSYCLRMEKLGLDAIEISGGYISKIAESKEEASYYSDFAKRLRKQISIPIILVGGNRSLNDLEKMHQEGVDMFAFCRPLICEPELILRWKKGSTEDSKCIFCNGCKHVTWAKCIFNN